MNWRCGRRCRPLTRYNVPTAPHFDQLRTRRIELTPVPADAEAKSIKCSECGKVFRSQATASFHAEKSGHENFEESTEEVSLNSLRTRSKAMTCAG